MPASSMCCITPAIQQSAAVAEHVEVELEGVLQEAVDQQRMPRASLAASHVALEASRRSQIAIARPPST